MHDQLASHSEDPAMAAMSTIASNHGHLDDSDSDGKSVFDEADNTTKSALLDGTPATSPGSPPAGPTPAAASFADIPTLADYLINGYWVDEPYQGSGPRHWDHNNLTVNIQDLTS